MDPQRKLHYLKALGLDVWLPHTELPGAREGQLFGRRPADSLANAGSAAVRTAEPAANKTEIPARERRPGLSQARESLQAGTDNRRSTVTRTLDAPLPDAAKANAGHQAEQENGNSQRNGVDHLALFILNCPGRLLLVDSSISSRAQQHLLRNMMFALTAAKPGGYKAFPFDSASAGGNGGQVDDILQGIVERSKAEGGAGVLLLGEGAQRAFNCGAPRGQPTSLGSSGGEVSAVPTYSAAELLEAPALKAQVWAHAQLLLSDAART